MIKLTASQIRYLDELAFDKQAQENMFRVALNFYTNQCSEMAKKERKFWNELREIHSLDKDKTYKTVMKEGMVCVEEVLDEA